MKEETREILACPHLQKLTADERRGVILDLLSSEGAFRPPRLALLYPDGVAVILCRRCYGKGRIVVRDGNGRNRRLKWAINLDAFKAK